MIGAQQVALLGAAHLDHFRNFSSTNGAAAAGWGVCSAPPPQYYGWTHFGSSQPYFHSVPPGAGVSAWGAEHTPQLQYYGWNPALNIAHSNSVHSDQSPGPPFSLPFTTCANKDEAATKTSTS
jgi:hypothetical protein